jgi:HEAT repeat protein
VPQGSDAPVSGRSPASGGTLRGVVNAIEDAHGVRIWLDSAIPGTTASDVDPTGLPVEEALRRAFRGYDLLLHFRPNPETGSLEIARAWVFPRGRVDQLQARAGAASAALGLHGSDPVRRALELHGVTAPPGTDPQEALRGALADPDEGVRQQALIAAQAAGVPVPADAIASLVLNDPSETVRMLALDLLTTAAEGDQETARAMLRRAAQDSSPSIRDRAADLLGALSAQPAGAAPMAETVPSLDTVMRDLETGDAQARQEALLAAQSHGIPVPPDRLEAILRYDASEGVRGVALSVLAVNSGIDPARIHAWLEWAARDSSPLVRGQAAALLGDLYPPTELPEEAGPGDSMPLAPDEALPDDPVGDGSGGAEDPGQ